MKLPKGWQKVCLKDVLSNVQYGTSAKSEVKGLFPVLRMGNLQNGKVDWSDLVYTSNKDEFENYSLTKGDILFNRTNSQDLVGKTSIYQGEHPAIFAGYLIKLQTNNKVCDSLFLNELMNSKQFKKFCDSVKTDAIGQSNINATNLQRWPFNLPPLPEQKAIAELLSTWDSAIDKTERLIAAKEKHFNWLLDELITKPSMNGKWREIRLSNILIEGSKTPVSDTSLYKKVTIKLRKKGIEFSDQTRIMADTRPFYVRQKGEIIVGKQNYFNGSIAIISDEFDGCICSNAIMSFGVCNSTSTEFLYEAISTNVYLKKREMLANGTGQKELSEKDFLEFTVALPDLETQKKIATILKMAKKEIFLTEEVCTKYKEQKSGLMQKLLTGIWRVKIS